MSTKKVLRAREKLRAALVKEDGSFNLELGELIGLSKTRVCALAMGLGSASEKEAEKVSSSLGLEVSQLFEGVEVDELPAQPRS